MSTFRLLTCLLLSTALPGCATSTDDDAGRDGPDGPDAGAGDANTDGGGRDAPLPLAPCSSAGETRVGPCGTMCGMASQRCSESLVWEDTSACLMEGVCPRGTAETRGTGMCGEETRLCQNDCTWTAWERTRPDRGECLPGQLRFSVDEARCGAARGSYEVCSDSCAFESGSGACTDGCGDTARTEPEWAREVCVPAGLFVRGEPEPPEDPDAANSPSHEIYLSPFYIGAYPVTRGRFRQCSDAEACTYLDDHFNYTREQNPLDYVTFDQAEYFCAWDEGRAVPTEAQWEKAARGPAPRTNLYVWGDESPRCDLLTTFECGYVDPTSTLVHDDPFDALPGTRSYYGTFRQGSGGMEWTADWFSDTYYRDPASQEPDPTGPVSGSEHTVRGAPPRSDGLGLSLRFLDSSAGIRCARSVEVTP